MESIPDSYVLSVSKVVIIRLGISFCRALLPDHVVVKWESVSAIWYYTNTP